MAGYVSSIKVKFTEGIKIFSDLNDGYVVT